MLPIKKTLKRWAPDHWHSDRADRGPSDSNVSLSKDYSFGFSSDAHMNASPIYDEGKPSKTAANVRSPFARTQTEVQFGNVSLPDLS